MTEMVTRCPECETSFRLKPAHLNSARGAVRCGSCLHIFVARDHLVTRSIKKTTPAEPSIDRTPPSPPEINFNQPQRLNPEPFEPEDPAELAPKAEPSEPEDSEGHTLKAKPSEPEAPEEHALKAEPSEPEDPEEHALKAEPSEPEDPEEHALKAESFEYEDPAEFAPKAESFTPGEPAETRGTDTDDQPPIWEPSPPGENSASQPHTNHDEDQNWDTPIYATDESIYADTEDFEPSLGETPDDFSVDTDLADDDILDLEPSSEPTDAFTFSDSFLDASGETPSTPDEPGITEYTKTPEEDTDEDWAANLLEELEEDTVSGEGQPQEITEKKEPFIATGSSNQADTSWIDQIEPTPLEIENPEQKPKIPTKALWGILSLIATLGLGAQFAYLGFDTYSRIEPWRTGYGMACQLGLCSLPSSSDTDRLKAYNLVVRSHPSESEALIVDAIILNTAQFEQPYPQLELSFSDISNNVLASRRFQPSEYLAGELAGQTVMPTGQPIHLSLEIVDPGPDAVGYSIRIH